jgi:hypothetical protein
MALNGNEDHDDQARSKATHETAFQSDAFERVPKRVPDPDSSLIFGISNRHMAVQMDTNMFYYVHLCSNPSRNPRFLKHINKPAANHPYP